MLSQSCFYDHYITENTVSQLFTAIILYYVCCFHQIITRYHCLTEFSEDLVNTEISGKRGLLLLFQPVKPLCSTLLCSIQPNSQFVVLSFTYFTLYLQTAFNSQLDTSNHYFMIVKLSDKANMWLSLHHCFPIARVPPQLSH